MARIWWVTEADVGTGWEPVSADETEVEAMHSMADWVRLVGGVYRVVKREGEDKG